jgi:glucose-6-phosphate isomerase
MTLLHETSAFKSLQNIPLPSLLECASEERSITHTHLNYRFTNTFTTHSILNQLQDIADEQHCIEALKTLHNGAPHPTTNDIIHVFKTRAPEKSHYTNTLDEIEAFETVILERNITDIVQVGIGGSHLGPESLYHALTAEHSPRYKVHFLSNNDPYHVYNILEKCNFETTLFIVASKSGDTLETLTNVAAIHDEAKRRNISQNTLKENMISITCKNSPLDKPNEYSKSFYISPEIGGRFSSTSAVGGVFISLVFGNEVFKNLLKGAHQMDIESQENDIRKNASLCAALIGILHRNVLHYPAKAIVPYASRLNRFVSHLQQLDCESNGKSVNTNGTPLPYSTAPIIFGETGTNCQHSFFQMLHQGTDITPVEFITTKRNFVLLRANLEAQEKALALGTKDANAIEHCPGNRPSTRLTLNDLSAQSIGSLLSFYENMIILQGFIWDINSFDQPGVQLGKEIALDILSKEKSK